MRTVITLFISALLLFSLPAHAEETLHNHDPALVGDWFATSQDGSLTELNFEGNGKFIFDQRDGSSIERTYMCGTWERNGEAIELDVRAEKSRAANGLEAETTGSRGDSFQVVRATRNTLVLRVNSEVFSFYRTG